MTRRVFCGRFIEMLRKREKTRKTCPRCKSVCDINEKKCEDCGLNFEKLQYASNRLAKKNFWAKKYDEIIKIPSFPSDVSRTQTLMLSIFLGVFGAHNFYVGRYYKGFFQLLMGILTVTLVIVASATSTVYNTLVNIIMPFIGVYALTWLFDVTAIIFGNYKIPISIDMSMALKSDYSREK